MPTSPTPFFVLLPGGWAQADSFLSKPLLGARMRTNDSLPWLSVATGVENGMYTLVPRVGLDAASASELVSGAQAHAQSQVPGIEWSVTEQSGLFVKKPSLVRAILTGDLLRVTPTIDHMDDLSSEQIASASAMAGAGAGAGAALKASEVIAVVPKRGWLLVAPGGPGQMQNVLKMSQAASGIHGRAEEQALSPHVFFWSGGRLAGYGTFGGGLASVSMILPDEDARPEAGWMI